MIDRVTPTLATDLLLGVLLLPHARRRTLKKYSLTVDKPTLKNFLNLLTPLPQTGLRFEKNHIRARAAE